MLHEFLATNRSRLIERMRARVAMRSDARATDKASREAIPLFLDQLVVVLQRAQRTPEPSDVAAAAVRYGGQLIELGFTVSQVVRD